MLDESDLVNDMSGYGVWEDIGCWVLPRPGSAPLQVFEG